MRTIEEFNKKYKDYLNHESGMLLEIPSVLTYVDQIFQDLIKIPDFKYQQIRTVYGLAKVVTNLQEIIPFVGRIIEQELEDKINFILKVEFEIENRLLTLNLDKNGNPIQSV
jgi:hypothetical protein